MEETQLKTGSSSGSQTANQTPQSATRPGSGGTQSSGLQPGTATSILNNSGAQGVSLNNTPLSTVSLAPSAEGRTTSTGTAPQAEPGRDINPALIALPVSLFLIAAVLAWLMSRSVKSTTHNW